MPYDELIHYDHTQPDSHVPSLGLTVHAPTANPHGVMPAETPAYHAEGPIEKAFGEYEAQTAHEQAVPSVSTYHGGKAVVNDAYTTGHEGNKFRAVGNVTYEGGKPGISTGPPVDIGMTREGGEAYYADQSERDKAIAAKLESPGEGMTVSPSTRATQGMVESAAKRTHTLGY